MAARWTENDTRLIIINLVDGFPVQQMMELFPNRSEGAIRLKAQDYDFGVTTSVEDGITRFYENIKSRVRNVNALSEIDEVNSIVHTLESAQPAQAMPSHSIDHLEPETRIVPDGFSANELAVNFLRDNRLNPSPEIIYQISLHILKEQR